MHSPSDYPRTFAEESAIERREAERRYDDERVCKQPGCGDLHETKPCEGCEEHFCGLHLYLGDLCQKCTEVELAAEEMERKEAA